MNSIPEAAEKLTGPSVPHANLVGASDASDVHTGVHTGASGVQTGTSGVHTGTPDVHTGAPGVHTGASTLHTGASGASSANGNTGGGVGRGAARYEAAAWVQRHGTHGPPSGIAFCSGRRRARVAVEMALE